MAPFKPQNMSNNAAVCADGGEIGCAQALQARAACLAPTVDMNPVLLKPEGNEGSQVIVHGRPWGKVDGRNFLQVRAALKDAVMESFGRLADQHDVIIVEGAGSPAEINLREGDIANMGFAETADLPVVLAGDVDKGGVFASLVGTLAFFSDAERARIKGFLINKFRGTRALLDPGLKELESRTGKPVLGVIPFLDELRLPEEDGFFLGGADNDGLREADPDRRRCAPASFQRERLRSRLPRRRERLFGMSSGPRTLTSAKRWFFQGRRTRWRTSFICMKAEWRMPSSDSPEGAGRSRGSAAGTR